MPRITVLFICLLLSFNLRAAPDLNAIMHDLGEQLLRILPLMHADSIDTRALQAELVELKQHFESADKHLAPDTGTRANYDALLRQLQRASDYSASTSGPMLRGELTDAFAICASCHRQDKKFVRSYGISRLRDLDELTAAEYGYLTRDYDAAITSYRNVLKTEQDDHRVQTALDRLLVITLEVYSDPKLATSVFNAVKADLAGASPGHLGDIDQWLVAFAFLTDDDSLQSPYAHRTIASMEKYLEDEWPALQAITSWNQQMVYWTAIRGRLNQMLQADPDPDEVPRILHWLAVSDRALHYRFYDSLSRQYLTRCIEEFPKHPAAKECLKEYEMLMIVSFSGSGGVFLPIEAQEELAALRRRIYPAPRK